MDIRCFELYKVIVLESAMEPVPGTSQAAYTSLFRNELVECLRSCPSTSFKGKCNHLNEFVKKAVGCDALSQESTQRIRHFTSQWKSQWDACARNYNNFCNKNRSWLDGRIKFLTSATYSERFGRPSIEFPEVSERSKRRRTEEVQACFSSEELYYAAQMQFKNDKKVDAANVIKDIISSPERVNEYIDAQRQSSLLIKPYLRDEALSITVGAKLTKYQYNIIRDAGCSQDAQ